MPSNGQVVLLELFDRLLRDWPKDAVDLRVAECAPDQEVLRPPNDRATVAFGDGLGKGHADSRLQHRARSTPCNPLNEFGLWQRSFNAQYGMLSSDHPE